MKIKSEDDKIKSEKMMQKKKQKLMIVVIKYSKYYIPKVEKEKNY